MYYAAASSGFDVSNHIATYSVSSMGANESVFSLFARYAGAPFDTTKSAFTLREAAATACTGNELGRSNQITMVNSANDSYVVRGR